MLFVGSSVALGKFQKIYKNCICLKNVYNTIFSFHKKQRIYNNNSYGRYICKTIQFYRNICYIISIKSQCNDSNYKIVDLFNEIVYSNTIWGFQCYE